MSASGLGPKSLNSIVFTAAASNDVRACSRCPAFTSPASATSNVRENPSSLASSPSRSIDPSPDTTRISVICNQQSSICQSANLTNLPMKQRLTGLANRAHIEPLDAKRGRLRPEELVVLARQRHAAPSGLGHLRQGRNRTHVPAEIIDSAFHLAALYQKDAVARQPREQRRLRIDSADIPETGDEQRALRPRDHLARRGPAAVDDEVVDVRHHWRAGFGRPVPRRDQILESTVTHPLGSRQLQTVVEDR